MRARLAVALAVVLVSLSGCSGVMGPSATPTPSATATNSPTVTPTPGATSTATPTTDYDAAVSFASWNVTNDKGWVEAYPSRSPPGWDLMVYRVNPGIDHVVTTFELSEGIAAGAPEGDYLQVWYTNGTERLRGPTISESDPTSIGFVAVENVSEERADELAANVSLSVANASEKNAFNLTAESPDEGRVIVNTYDGDRHLNGEELTDSPSEVWIWDYAYAEVWYVIGDERRHVETIDPHGVK